MGALGGTLPDPVHLSNLVWTTKAGTKVAIRDLKDSHLMNCIKHVQKRPATNMGAVMLTALLQEALRRNFAEAEDQLFSELINDLHDPWGDN